MPLDQLLIQALLFLLTVGLAAFIARRLILRQGPIPTVPLQGSPAPAPGPSLSNDQRLARLERQVARLMQELGIADDGQVPADDLESRIRPLIIADQKIQAIKVVRDQTGLGLKEAKDLVEDLEYRIHRGG